MNRWRRPTIGLGQHSQIRRVGYFAVAETEQRFEEPSIEWFAMQHDVRREWFRQWLITRRIVRSWRKKCMHRSSTTTNYGIVDDYRLVDREWPEARTLVRMEQCSSGWTE